MPDFASPLICPKLIGKAASAAVLFASIFAAAPVASAKPALRDEITMRFAFDRTAPAELTYNQLRIAASRACKGQGVAMAARARNFCANEMVHKGVIAMADTRLAQLHQKRTGRSTASFVMAGR